jgi:hypothetical protein
MGNFPRKNEAAPLWTNPISSVIDNPAIISIEFSENRLFSWEGFQDSASIFGFGEK